MASKSSGTGERKSDWRKRQRKHNTIRETGTQIRAATTEIAESVQEERTADKKLLTEDEVNQELMKIIIGMAEIADGKKKVTEAAEILSNAGIIDKATLLERLSDPKTLEGFNAYLEKNPPARDTESSGTCRNIRTQSYCKWRVCSVDPYRISHSKNQK